MAFFISSTVLITPATPEDASVCPVFAFPAVIHNGDFLPGTEFEYTEAMDLISTASPTTVPVPCASIN